MNLNGKSLIIRSVCVIGGLIAWHLALKTKTFISKKSIYVYMCSIKVMHRGGFNGGGKYQKFHLNHRIKGLEKGI
jgi:hypothetical protein